MRIAVFSDIHGNYLNLISFYKSALKLKIDNYICLGDLCNYYPDNEKVINFIKENSIICLRGNHDEFYISGKISKEKKLIYNFDEALLKNKTCMDFINSMPLSYQFEENEKSIFFCHASPKDFLNTYIYPTTDLRGYENVPYDIVFMGHTHRQFLKKQNDKIFCNVGSIGLPRDNGSLMSFAVLDTENMDISLYRKKVNVNEIKKEYGERLNKVVLELLKRNETINYNYILLNE